MSAGDKIRVLVVDDDPNFAEAARALLAADQRLEVVGRAESGEEAVAKAAALHPQVVAMDVAMPGMDGHETTRHVREAAGQLKHAPSRTSRDEAGSPEAHECRARATDCGRRPSIPPPGGIARANARADCAVRHR